MKKQGSSLPIATGEFTASHSSILTQVSVTSEDGNVSVDDVTALWDTGSEFTGISKALAKRMGLKPLPQKQWIGYANGSSELSNTYRILITFPPSGRRADTYAYEFRGKGQDVIIGMNIIRNGRFMLEPTDDGGMKFTFTVG
jgi:hypothetical protein